MPTRIIRDGILTSERVNELSTDAELFYRRLMSVADDNGRYSANLTQLRAYCYPLKLDKVKEDSIRKCLQECVSAGLIVTYTVSGKAILQLIDFGQRINGKSKYPENPGDSPGIPGDSRLGGGEGEGEGEDVGGGGKGNVVPPDCPHQDIVDLYHELLPANPRMKAWGDDRKANLRTRWREDPKRQSLDYWRHFFTVVSQSDFLTGRTGKPGERPFFAGLDWLVMPKNFLKVIEGRYHDRGNA